MLTRENATQRPELFLHDHCLPEELRRKPDWPSICRDCGVEVESDAEGFLHACLHSNDPKWVEFGNPRKLNKMPYILFPVVAKLMEEYKRHV